jgi:hypothetical protein
MISSRFHYASLRVGFGSAGTAAYQAAQTNNSKINSAIATGLSGASSSSPFESASQASISGSSTLAAHAAIARVNAQKKAQSVALLKQIDSAQATLDQQKAVDALKQKYYVYTLPAVIVDVSSSDTGTTTDTTA